MLPCETQRVHLNLSQKAVPRARALSSVGQQRAVAGEAEEGLRLKQGREWESTSHSHLCRPLGGWNVIYKNLITNHFRAFCLIKTYQ